MATLVAKEIGGISRNGLHPTYQAVVDAIGRIPGDEPLSLLDVGCGVGLYRRVLADVGRVRYEGTDFNTVMLADAQGLFPGTTFHLADACDLPFEDGSYDVVLAGAVLEHIKEWRQALAEMCRVARGWLVLHRTLLTMRNEPTRTETQSAFGDVWIWRVYINQVELFGELARHDFVPVGEAQFIDIDTGARVGQKGVQWTFLCEAR